MISSIILGVVLAASATSEPAPRTADAASANVQKTKPKKICRTVGLTGSRIAKKQCKTQEQWDQAEYAAELSVKGKAGTTMPPQMDTGI
ncbi:hypothetical protein [Sphingorhabdus sp.]|uniref:hypothetical protein n=1 Tax=Sphingorhabdus sp. TaxID=1902408 RepID=UPI0039835449